MMIYTNTTSKKKKRKPNAKARALKSSWEEILKKYDVKAESKSKKTQLRHNSPTVIIHASRDTSVFPSVDSGYGIAVKKESPKYTGDSMIGIGQLHKSNAVPIFKAEDAIEISRMRRG